MNDAEIRAVFLRHGFTIKPGETDLKPYVYAAARELIAAAAPDAQARHVADAEPSVGDDVYEQLSDMIAPHVTDAPGGLPGSVIGAFAVLLDHWKVSCQQTAPTAPPAEAVEGKEFQRAWIQLPKLPGGMMHSGEVGDFGPVPASCSAWVTTSEREMKSWGEPSIEVWLARPAAPLSDVTDAMVEAGYAASFSVDVSRGEVGAIIRAAIAATSAGEGQV